jgi:predicted DNA-binding WGR domain protein
MAKRKRRTCSPQPVQLLLFPERALLARLPADRAPWRYYRLEVWPDLFGRAMLLRQWGGRGAVWRSRLDAFPDAGAALNALADIARTKLRRGYTAQDGGS